MTDEELREAARAAIKAGKLPMPADALGGEPYLIVNVPKTHIRCIACEEYMYAGEASYRLAAYEGQPVMHYPQCFNAWHQAARDEWGKAFDDEHFHVGDERTGEGFLIRASLPRSVRVRFFVNRSILMGVLGCTSAFADNDALARCRELQPIIEVACRQAFGERPGDFIELQETDFV